MISIYGCKIQDSKNLHSDNSLRIIKDVNVFTGENYFEKTNLVYNQESIVEISKDISSYKASEIFDGAGKTIIPPLANAHVHLWFADSLKYALNAGIFANFDMHNTDESSNQLRSLRDSLNHSFYYSANAAATVPGGHGTQFGIPVPTINDSISPERFVQDRIAADADYIKVIKEPMMNTLTDEQSERVILEAHKNKVLAVGHSHNISETMTLVQQDIDGIVHIWFDKKASESQLETIKEEDVFLVPTILVTKKLLDLGQTQGWADRVLSLDELLEEIGRAHKKGINILCGTDSPNFGLNYSSSMFDEMDLLSEAGLSNLEVLKAATTNVYECFKLKEFSALKPGSKPNFILVDGNPIVTLKDLRNQKIIIRNGIKISGN